jgi:hypothetical protein
MQNLEGIEYEKLVIGKNMGTHQCNVSRKLILSYIKNTGIDCKKFEFDNSLIAPAAMVFIFTLRTIFSNNIPIGGAVLAGQSLECIEPIREGDNITVDVVIKDKYIKKERKYVLLDFLVKGDKGNTKIINTMRAIWPK